MKLVFIWENLGPTHVDRCDSVAAALPDCDVIGIEMFETSGVYEWERVEAALFRRMTLFGEPVGHGVFARLRRLIAACSAIGRGAYFLCHYERAEIFLLALWLRLTGNRVIMMADSKFDDYPRSLPRELAKRLVIAPYSGALVAARRSRDYMHFLGFGRRPVETGYDTLSIDRMRSLSPDRPTPDGVAFADRGFIVVARMVPKKNLDTVLDAYARYRDAVPSPRLLTFCGAGPLDSVLRAKARDLGIEAHVDFRGNQTAGEVATALGRSLALLLPSTEEQFGLVVIEALALGLPVIVSLNCGARDELVRSGLNGFIVEPDNPDGIAWFMERLSTDEPMWRAMALAARERAELGDSRRFATAVARLAGLGVAARDGRAAASLVDARD